MKMKISPNSTFWDWSLFFSILLYQAIPSFYTSYSIYLIGNSIPNENSLAIVSQWQFIQVILEIIQESLVFPIFYFVGSQFKKDINALRIRISFVFQLLFLILIPVTIILFYQIDLFINLINTPREIIQSTKNYLEIRIWALTFSILNLGLIIIIESLNKKKLLLKILFIKMICYFFFDALFFGGYNFSMDLDIKGVALSNLIVEIIILLFAITRINRLFQSNLLELFTTKIQFKNLKLFGRISIGIGIESLVKNIAYLTMIIAIINELGPEVIGGYYLSMHLFWSFLVVPVLSLSDTMKVLIANNSNNLNAIKSLLKYGLIIVLILCLCWLLIFPFVDSIFGYFNSNITIVKYAKSSFYILILPYILLAINLVINSLFYGLGDTKYLAYKSVLTNCSVYLIAFTLYKTEIWHPTFSTVLILFSIGILVGTILTFYFAKKVLSSFKLSHK